MNEKIVTAARDAVADGHVRHYGGFLAAGLAALATDTAVLTALTRGAGVSPFIARPVGIGLAMIVSWLINRNVTFKTSAPPSVGEFAKFASVAITSQAINYLVFAALLLSYPAMMPEVALLLACLVSMFTSYAGYRFGVFKSSGVPGSGGGK
jgi:putative flippase GtrA